MKLLRLITTGIRGLADRTHDFTDARTGAPLDVAIVTGPASSGKTSLLAAIAAAKEAVGRYGAPLDPSRFRRRGSRAASITATWLLSEPERTEAGLDHAQQTATWDLGRGNVCADADPRLRKLFARFSCAPDHGKLEYFPASRRVITRAAFPRPRASEAAEARLRATSDPDKYADLVPALGELARDDAAQLTRLVADRGIALRSLAPSSLTAYKNAVATMLPDLRLSEVESGERGPVVRFIRRDRTVLTLDELSASEQQGALFALAFRRYGLDGSLVLIDEPELHVHAADRVRFLQAIVTLGRDNQVIAATGSAEMVTAASPWQIVDLSRPAPALRAAG
jgi:predicted ATPase